MVSARDSEAREDAGRDKKSSELLDEPLLLLPMLLFLRDEDAQCRRATCACSFGTQDDAPAGALMRSSTHSEGITCQAGHPAPTFELAEVLAAESPPHARERASCGLAGATA